MKLGNNSQLKYLFKNLIDGADDSVDVIGKALKTPKQLPDTGTTASYDWIDDILDGWITPSRTPTHTPTSTPTPYAPPASVADPVRQEALKNALISKRGRIPFARWGTQRPPALASGAPDYLGGDIEAFFNNVPVYGGKFPFFTNWLGDVTYDEHTGWPTPYFGANATRTPPLDTSELVLQSSNSYFPMKPPLMALRPHKNTRLGKWFAERFPNWYWDSGDPSIPF